MAESISRLMVILYIIATIFLLIGLYVLSVNRFIGIGIVVLAIMIYLMPMTRPRY